MEVEEAEVQLGMTFSERHRHALLDATDPIHDACDMLALSSPHEFGQIVTVNAHLHTSDHWNWPPFLVAFASNGCADYFAYDLRAQPARVIYIDPDFTVDENLASEDKLEYGSFDKWYMHQLVAYRRMCEGRDFV